MTSLFQTVFWIITLPADTVTGLFDELDLCCADAMPCATVYNALQVMVLLSCYGHDHLAVYRLDRG